MVWKGGIQNGKQESTEEGELGGPVFQIGRLIQREGARTEVRPPRQLVKYYILNDLEKSLHIPLHIRVPLG